MATTAMLTFAVVVEGWALEWPAKRTMHARSKTRNSIRSLNQATVPRTVCGLHRRISDFLHRAILAGRLKMILGGGMRCVAVACTDGVFCSGEVMASRREQNHVGWRSNNRSNNPRACPVSVGGAP